MVIGLLLILVTSTEILHLARPEGRATSPGVTTMQSWMTWHSPRVAFAKHMIVLLWCEPIVIGYLVVDCTSISGEPFGKHLS